MVLAEALLAKTDLPLRPRSLLPLSGGANNRVFKLECEEGSLLLKSYFSDSADSRNRCKSDYEFCQFAWNQGITAVPRPLSVCWEQHAALYEFVVGRRIKPDEVTPTVLGAAAGLFEQINLKKEAPEAAHLQFAAESCFSVGEHLACVERRISRLGLIDQQQSLGEEALALVREEILPAWESSSITLRRSLSPSQMDAPIELSERCLSPSDFGFHNALRQEDGEMRFFDFEYAGWDDPAKMICDFFCQPEVPVPIAHFDSFTAKALASFEASAPILDRAWRLLPIYRLKWCCIMLNEFLPADRRRRSFSNPHEDALSRKRNQLAKAKHSLNQ